MDYEQTDELINVLKDIREELKTQNDRLEKIEVSINQIGGFPWTLLENLPEVL